MEIKSYISSYSKYGKNLIATHLRDPSRQAYIPWINRKNYFFPQLAIFSVSFPSHRNCNHQGHLVFSSSRTCNVGKQAHCLVRTLSAKPMPPFEFCVINREYRESFWEQSRGWEFSVQTCGTKSGTNASSVLWKWLFYNCWSSPLPGAVF